MRKPRKAILPVLLALFAALAVFAAPTATAVAEPAVQHAAKAKHSHKRYGKANKRKRMLRGADRRARTASGQIGLSDNRRLSKQRARQRAKQKQAAAAEEPLPPGVIFRGDQISDFWLAQSAPGAISETPDPAGSGQTVFRMTVSDADVYPVTPTENPRAELLSPSEIVSGQEFWWSTKFFLPADFPASTSNFVTLLQGPYGKPWNGTPPFHIEVNGGSIKWQRNATYDWDIPWEMPLVRNSWVSVMVHERFGPDGWLELWINGQPITFFAGDTHNPNREAPTSHLPMATMDSSNDLDQGNSIYLQSYRKKGMFSSLTVYHGPLTIGTTRSAVGG